MTAMIGAKGKKKMMPNTRLAMAAPLVGMGSDGEIAVAASKGIGCPQVEQNRAEASVCGDPHFVQ